MLLAQFCMLTFPFIARCRTCRVISPLQEGDEVDVIDMAPEVTHADDQTRQAAEDWHYWIERGYQF